ncbi:uncharacterized protein LOC118102230 [Hippoglossus stenolepis]|uniref:uncharacterized protein LOC118102230 n=1 Tax=Hippoglossus stenolepis TaxID=195615 RepID=UPI001FAFCFBF|nr:uncharacterized protein LOC118102230 [Hippoglossus stenolepis]
MWGGTRPLSLSKLLQNFSLGPVDPGTKRGRHQFVSLWRILRPWQMKQPRWRTASGRPRAPGRGQLPEKRPKGPEVPGGGTQGPGGHSDRPECVSDRLCGRVSGQRPESHRYRHRLLHFISTGGDSRECGCRSTEPPSANAESLSGDADCGEWRVPVQPDLLSD